MGRDQMALRKLGDSSSPARYLPLPILDPTTGATRTRYSQPTPAELESKISRAAAEFVRWSRIPVAKRTDHLRAVAKLFRVGAPRWAELMATEMGKPVREGVAESEKCAWACEHYAEHAEAYLLPESLGVSGSVAVAGYEPVGVVLGVMPWNFPFWQAIRFAVPALAAGNVVLLKPASNVAGCGLALEKIFRKAGAPAGAFQTLLLESSRVAEVVGDPRVRMVSVTGGYRAGTEVARAAGAVAKKVLLELGGSDPFLVLGDADVRAAAVAAVTARFQNTGESCIAAKRFIVVNSCLAEFLEVFEARVLRLRVGDPHDSRTDVGPLAKKELREELVRQIEGSVRAGARIRLGGAPREGPGFFFPPTVVDRVRPGMPLFDEEVFGPVASIISAPSDAGAVALANESRFGLGASLWTRDPRRASELAREIQVGMVFVNGMVRSDPRVPFGGVKESGFGRELGRHGLRELTTTKLVWIEGGSARGVDHGGRPQVQGRDRSRSRRDPR
ncbi:MAG: NAD-dependent succinate-semialdehyde dehydrogenase [Thermoplasmata archaeon]|nr:NAD-dependent succinate-semialdehyde dehydrogenase [Thermoplasmata archaeon]